MDQDPRAGLLVAQDRQRPRQAAEEQQPKAKRVQEIWAAETKADAEAALLEVLQTIVRSQSSVGLAAHGRLRP
jgi:hypothetical protein